MKIGLITLLSVIENQVLAANTFVVCPSTMEGNWWLSGVHLIAGVQPA